MDQVRTIEVERVAPDRVALDWVGAFGDVPVAVGVSAKPDAIEAVSGGTVARRNTELTVPREPARPYFRLKPADGAPLIVAERALPLVGGVNFRDIGGYATDDGRRVRWGRLYRSGHLSGLTAIDRERVAALGIGTVVDFRIREECATENAELPNAPIVHILGIEPGIGDRFYLHRLMAEARSPEPVRQALHDIMRLLVRGVAARYAPLFKTLLEDPPGSVLMNCSGGKERTGVAAALLLSALGVPRETIMYDFMLSSVYMPAAAEVPRVIEKYEVGGRGELAAALVMPILETHASYLQAAFDAIDEDFGSSEAFLVHHYGLGAPERARLRDIYTA